MHQGLIETTAKNDEDRERRIYGVAVAKVLTNLDETNQGRVQIALPWMPCVKPWARVAVPMTGKGSGTFFMPQEGDEVLVAFSNGNINEPYVVGSLWNGQDNTPTQSSADAINKQIIHTPKGHELVFDDANQTISIHTSTKQKITIGPEKIEITADSEVQPDKTATVTLEKSGKITITSSLSIEVKAPNISIEGDAVKIKGKSTASLEGGSHCQIKAVMVDIN